MALQVSKVVKVSKVVLSKVVFEVCLADSQIPLDLYGLIITLNSDAYLW
jgi:hypothetical protein